jgi:hypothetical protein
MPKKKQEKRTLTPEEREKTKQDIKRMVGFLGIFLVVVGGLLVTLKAAIFLIIGLTLVYFGFLNKYSFSMKRRD